MNKNPLISIVIPIYNAEKYLPMCLESILKQSYSELEIICVNDGSTDESSDLLRTYANSDKRIKIIDKKNEGVSSARNTGIEKACGEYLIFVDADDWIDSDTCGQALQAMVNNQADVVFWSYVSESNGLQSYKRIFNKDIVFDKVMCEDILHRRYVGLYGEELKHPEMSDSLSPVWGKMYKLSLVRDIQAQFVNLDEIGTYEDGLFNLNVFGCIKKAVYLNKNYYHYRRDNIDSATSKYNPRLVEQWANLYSIIEDYIKTNINDTRKEGIYLQALENRKALGIQGIVLNICSENCSFLKKRRELREVLKTERYHKALETLDVSEMPIYWRLFYQSAKEKKATALILARNIFMSFNNIRSKIKR